MKKIILLILFPVLCYANPVYVDLDVGDSTYFNGKTITLLRQSVDEILVDVNGVQETLNLFENDCGSPRNIDWHNINGVDVMPDIVADIQNYCLEHELDRRWVRNRVSWESGNVVADRDYDNAARLVLKKPGEKLVNGNLPIETASPCTYYKRWKSNYFLSNSPTAIHSGIDFFDKMGTKIISATEGTITHLVRDFASGYPCAKPDYNIPTTVYSSAHTGNFVIISDGTYSYKYAHLNKVNNGLYVGKYVRIGDYIGDMGCTATSSSHLHFAMFLNNGISPVWDIFNINAHPYLMQWSCGTGCNVPLYHNDYCRYCGPCEEGEGDCDSDSECAGDLVCGQVSGTDYCEKSEQECYDVITTECKEVVTTICP